MIDTLRRKWQTSMFLLTQCRSIASLAAMKGCGGPETTAVSLRCAREPILCRRGTSDFSVIWEIFGNREYESLDGWPYRRVLDLGANSGIFAAYAWTQSGGALTHYVGVEPDREGFEALRLQVECQGMAGVSRLFPCAAWDSEGTMRFDDSGQSYERRLSDDGAVEVPTRTIDSILDEAGLDFVDLIKMDVEGAEERLLADMGRWGQRAGTLVAELHGQLNFDWFAECVRAAGFEPLRTGELFKGHLAARAGRR